MCRNGRAIDIEGGCHAYLAKHDHEYSMVFQPGFNSLVGVIEHDAESGTDTSIMDNGFNKAKLFCKLDKPGQAEAPSIITSTPQPPPAVPAVPAVPAIPAIPAGTSSQHLN